MKSTRAKAKTPARQLPAGVAELCDAKDLCAVLKIGTSKFKEMRATGMIPPPSIKLGKLNRWTVADVNAMLDRLAAKREV